MDYKKILSYSRMVEPDEKLALKLGVSAAVVANYRAGRTEPDITALPVLRQLRANLVLALARKMSDPGTSEVLAGFMNEISEEVAEGQELSSSVLDALILNGELAKKK